MRLKISLHPVTKRTSNYFLASLITSSNFFYPKFFQNHASLLHYLSHFLQKGIRWTFAEENRVDFNIRKSAFLQPISLTSPRRNVTNFVL